MEYRKFDQGLIVRLDPGEEIIEALTQLARQEDIALASISGLGAANEVTIGIFDTEHKTYGSKTYQGLYEIAALVGYNDEYYFSRCFKKQFGLSPLQMRKLSDSRRIKRGKETSGYKGLETI